MKALYSLCLTALLVISACNITPMADWNYHEVAVGDVSVSFELPPDQSREGPGRAVPLESVSLDRNLGPDYFQAIFDGFWDYRTSRFRPVDGSVHFDLAVAELTVAVANELDDLSEYSIQIYLDTVTLLKALNLEQAQNDMPLYQIPARPAFETMAALP